MTLNQIWNMVLRIFIRKGVNWGINKGMGHMSSAGRKAAGAGARQGGAGPANAAQAHQARELAKRARKAARLTRRVGR